MKNKSIQRIGRNPLRTLKRLLTFMFSMYRLRLVVVILLILVAAYANVRGSLFLQVVIDQYITPMLATSSRDFSGLLKAVITMAGIYLTGILAALVYNLLMVTISEGTQKKIRDQMFQHLEKLPLRYFDSHADGDIMSHFTNDTDTLRQMISQSIPNLLMALVTFVSVFIAMISLSIPLTLFVVCSVSLMFFVIRTVANRSSRFFGQQQRNIGW
ncbi:ABC-type multidrug transport system fused ATPase/permease subunit [Enterococcus sp. PF1-24]|nr:ABC-type multidrug transport system fused ATPase/permease subunit [Enterococcus sp. PFB1-1]MDH6401991.1 ABC-type multidrug transport system fused ATPase/permease subunit [Enterococcus sp. PF1-24]